VDFEFFLNRARRVPGSKELALPPEPTRTLHRWLVDGIRTMDAGQDWTPEPSPRPRFGWWRVVDGFVANYFPASTLQGRFAELVCRALQEAQKDIRRCGFCQSLFYPRGRQAYCSARCSQRERTRRFKEILGGDEAFSERRHRYYRAKIERERGSSFAVKVRRRPAKKELQQ
jgi:hypothetical protein